MLKQRIITITKQNMKIVDFVQTVSDLRYLVKRLGYSIMHGPCPELLWEITG